MGLGFQVAHLQHPLPCIAVGGQRLKGGLRFIEFAHGKQRFGVGIAGGLNPLDGIGELPQGMEGCGGLVIFYLGQQFLRPGVAHILDPLGSVFKIPQGLEGGNGLLKSSLVQQLLRLGIAGLLAAGLGVAVVPQGIEDGGCFLRPALVQQLFRLGILVPRHDHPGNGSPQQQNQHHASKQEAAQADFVFGFQFFQQFFHGYILLSGKGNREKGLRAFLSIPTNCCLCDEASVGAATMSRET